MQYRQVCLLTFASLLIIPIANVEQVSAHNAGFTLTGLGTATIDGVLSPGEWDNAGSINFQANLPAIDGGGTTPATLMVMNDGDTLYLALVIERSSLDNTSFNFHYDNDDDGVREDGDDVVVMNAGPSPSAIIVDDFRNFPNFPRDTNFGGTNDGVGDAANDGTFSVYEQSRPLNSADDAHDFSLNIGDTVGYSMQLFIFSSQGTFPDNRGETVLPPGAASNAPTKFGDIIIGTSEIKSVGGEMIPIETTSLILAGAQSSTWLIPVVLSIVGIGIVLVRRK